MARPYNWRKDYDWTDEDDYPVGDDEFFDVQGEEELMLPHEIKKPADDSGIMNQASGRMDKDVLIRIVVEEFIKRKGRKPRSLEEIKEFYIEMQGGGNQATGPGVDDPNDEYESYRMQQIDIDPSKVLSFDEWYKMEYEGDRNIGARGGLASILGV